MPHLNPNPLFIIFLLTWFTLSLLVQPKLLSFTPTNPPSYKALTTKTTSWTWPWI
uniref:ATP synthase complex subunit 8 n=1 Tax=Nothocrax urumutum TaxID=125065 RepID=Q69I67_9GALL|nr:ATP synthase F0 subunit 8 [Nothocrax urumutum]